MVAVWLAEPSREASAYRDLLLDSRQRGLLLNTAILGIGTALAATLVGVPLGVALARVALPFKASLRILLGAPALLPSYIIGLAWLSVSQASWMHSLPAAVLVLTVVFYPLSMLITEAAVRGMEPRLEEAASLTAPPGRVLWRITLPLALPSILAAALVVFVLAISDFGVPALLRVPVFTTEIFTAFAALYDSARATALAVPLLLLTLFVAVADPNLHADRQYPALTGRGLGIAAGCGDFLPVGCHRNRFGCTTLMTAPLLRLLGVTKVSGVCPDCVPKTRSAPTIQSTLVVAFSVKGDGLNGVAFTTSLSSVSV
jgi:ABC-type Fe3+ transport system permease subunit